jgi:glycosyltransferase involved in cell wall biosynthesis
MKSTIQPIRLAIILPCYNEEEILTYSATKLLGKLNELIDKSLISKDSFLYFVDDGSQDNTWPIITQLQSENPHIKGLKFSTNFGHQNAIFAGMMKSKDISDVVITIDVDLQDDIHVFEKMIQEYYAGNLIVYGVRDNRENDSVFKRFTAQSFYKLMIWMKVKSIYNHADFRLIDTRVLNELEKFNEVSLFLRGIFPLLGYKNACVYYKREIRIAGESKYPLRKMLNFAWNGITSFSTAPLRYIFYLGITMFCLSMFFGLWVVIATLFGHTVKGWSSTLLVNLIFSGLNMICLGIIGEYTGKIYQEVKQRPRYIIDKEI